MSTLDVSIETMPYIRCVTCGKVIGHMYERANGLRAKNFDEQQIFEELGLKRTCCRFHLSTGFKMPIVKYLDETARLDLDEECCNEGKMESHLNSNNTDQKVSSIKDRLIRLKDGKKSDLPPQPKRISYFVAT